MVAGCRLIVTGSAFGSAFAAMIAPRKLQSLGATVHALAPAVSSVRSTSNVVVNSGRGADECEAARCVKLRKAPNKTTRLKMDQVIVLFMVYSCKRKRARNVV